MKPNFTLTINELPKTKKNVSLRKTPPSDTSKNVPSLLTQKFTQDQDENIK